MDQQQPHSSKPFPASSTLDHHHLKRPARPACGSGSAGGTSGTAEGLGKPKQPPLPLPGIERFFPPEAPLELDSSSETLTEIIDRILEKPSHKRNLSALSWDQKNTVLDWEDNHGMGVGACLNVFPSGEVTGGCYSLGRTSAPGTKGKAVSQEFTKQARKAIRRAVESKTTAFKLFITLTFDPKSATLNESGQVDHDWAKKEFTRFLNTIKKKYDRLADKTGKDHRKLSYIWVAEIQEMNTNNIHFHILANQPFIPAQWLATIWGQSSNSVNVKKLNNQEHAANYMLKYMKKGNCPIRGKRYGMTQDLIKGAKPVTHRFDGRGKRNAFLQVMRDLSWEIEQNGGHALEWGFQIPAPRRESIWRDRQGKTHTKKGTSSQIASKLLDRVNEAVDGIDAALAILDDENFANRQDENEGADDEYIPF